eukprot:1266692-Rhodomonas_salina.2
MNSGQLAMHIPGTVVSVPASTRDSEASARCRHCDRDCLKMACWAAAGRGPKCAPKRHWLHWGLSSCSQRLCPAYLRNAAPGPSSTAPKAIVCPAWSAALRASARFQPVTPLATGSASL